MSTVINLDALGDRGFVMHGERKSDHAGMSVASAGDIDGDGFADVIVGAPRNNDGGNQAGSAYVIFGHAGDFDRIGLGKLSPEDGFAIRGGKAEGIGYSVASAGDVNGDGFDDVTIGEYRNGANGYGAGAAYVVFGEKPTDDVTQIGSEASQTIHGGFGDDTLRGGGGDDVLIGAEGNDSLQGQGGGDDLNGGDGDDKLTGGVGDDIMHGGDGGDRLLGHCGRATLRVRRARHAGERRHQRRQRGRTSPSS